MEEPRGNRMHLPSPTAADASRSLPIYVSLVAAVVFFCLPQSMADPDIWWHLRDAQVQWASHTFLTHDLFSFTAAGAPWMNHEWLGELPFYAGYRLLGVSGLYFVTLLTLELIFLGLFWLAWMRSRSLPAAAFASVVGIFLSVVSFGPRTLLFGWLLLLIELFLFAELPRRDWIVWTLPALFLVWVNTHGSWVIGLVLFSLFVFTSAFSVTWGDLENHALAPQKLRRLGLSWILSVLALFANPYGWRLVFYPFNLAFRQKLNIANVEEWRSLDFHAAGGRMMLGALLLLALLHLVRSRRWSLFELALAAVGIYSAFTYTRFLFLAALLLMPSLAASLAPRTPSTRTRLSPAVTGALVFVILCFVAGRARTLKPRATETDLRYPGKALPFLASFHPQGRVLNEYLWGGYLIWNAHHLPVFVDSRVDIFEYNGTFKDYLDIVRIRNPLELLDRHQIRYVLFERDAPLTYLLQSTHAWKVDYEDETTVLLERKAP